MSEALAVQAPQISSYERALILGDLAGLKQEERLSYYKAVCESVGLNPLTKPFDYITLNGKMVLYATRACTDQLRKIHGVSVTDLVECRQDGVLSITCKVSDKSGRTDIATGALTISGLKGNDMANALMKAETKAKRRATLSICGLGLLDETELETIPQASTEVAVIPLPTLAPVVNQQPAPPPVPVPLAEAVINAAADNRLAGLPAAVQTVNTPPTAPFVSAVIPEVSTVKLTPLAPSPTKMQGDITVPPKPVAPVSATVETAVKSETPATQKEIAEFLARAAKVMRDKLPKAGMKDQEASNGVKNYLLKQSGKPTFRVISAAVFENMLKTLEAGTPEETAAIVRAGCK